MTREIAGTATDAACRILGRRSVVRAARYVLLRARLDYPNDMMINGEARLQCWILGLPRKAEPVHIADVGANIGQWSRSLLAAGSAAGCSVELSLHAFEPHKPALEQLIKELGGTSAVINQVALSDHEGVATFHVVGPCAGTNTLHRVPGTALKQEIVATTTLDRYAVEHGVKRFALVKVDTEGHDLSVIRGARTLLSEQRIDFIQFEYNHRWVFARAYLHDAFEFLGEFGYQIGKLTPRGLESYPGWDPELETFVEGNYVAYLPAAAVTLPSVPWWKVGA